MLCTVLSPLSHDQVDYGVGAQVDLPPEVAAYLTSTGTVEVLLPKTNPDSHLEAESETETPKVNLNTAPLEALSKLKHIGEAAAQRLIEARPLESLEAAQKVSGLSDSRWKTIVTQLEV